MFGLQLLAKASYFLQLVEMEASTSIVFLILGIVIGLFANVASIWVVARVGRRYLVVGSLVIAAALWASMGIANCSKIVAGVTWWTAISMMLVILVCGLGVWPASYAIAAETSSLQLRARTQGIGWFVSALTTTVAGVALPYVFNPDEGNLRGKTGFTYAASCALGAVVSWYIVPEMKGMSVREIDAMFNEGIAARKFKSWRETGTEVPGSQASERAFA
jgi:MFS family permease